MPLLHDPVCGTIVDSTHAAARTRHNDHLYFFCSSTCKASFERDPERHIGKAAKRPGQPDALPPTRPENRKS